MFEFTINTVRNLPTPVQLWEKVQEIQLGANAGVFKEEDILSGEFLLLCKAALRSCEKYKLPKGFLRVHQDKGTLPLERSYNGITSVIFFNGEVIHCSRNHTRKIIPGDRGILRCTILLPITYLSAIESMEKEGWEKTDAWKNFLKLELSLKAARRIVPQPKPTDAVLGLTLFPRSSDAVLSPNENSHMRKINL